MQLYDLYDNRTQISEDVMVLTFLRIESEACDFELWIPSVDSACSTYKTIKPEGFFFFLIGLRSLRTNS